LERGVAFWGMLFSLAVALLAAAFDYYTRDDAGRARSWATRLKSPRWLARAGMSIFFGLSMALFAQQFVTPTDFDILKGLLDDLRAGQVRTSHKLDDIVDGQEEANRKLDAVVQHTAPKPWRGFENIDGWWGEEHGECKVVYRFERRDHGLVITLVRKEPAMADYRMTASITPHGQGDVVNAALRSSTSLDEGSGQALTFTYSDDGVTRRLDWLNETRTNAGALKLEPCEAIR